MNYNFCLFVYLRSYNDKIIFKNSAVKPQHVLFANKPFLRKMLVSFFSSNNSLYIGKNPVEKLCKVLEMEIKIYTPVSPKSVIKKIKFKALHYIQHDSIRQRPGLSKNQTSMSKSLTWCSCCFGPSDSTYAVFSILLLQDHFYIPIV